MAIGTREQPEKHFDKKTRCGKTKRSWKAEKVGQNRKGRRLARVDPQTPPRPKYDGCEWCNPKRFIEEKRKARKDKERPKYKD